MRRRIRFEHRGHDLQRPGPQQARGLAQRAVEEDDVKPGKLRLVVDAMRRGRRTAQRSSRLFTIGRLNVVCTLTSVSMKSARCDS